MTQEELTKRVCQAASQIAGKEITERRLDIGTKALIAVLSDDVPFSNESYPEEAKDPGETLNAGGEVDGSPTTDNE